MIPNIKMHITLDVTKRRLIIIKFRLLREYPLPHFSSIKIKQQMEIVSGNLMKHETCHRLEIGLQFVIYLLGKFIYESCF